MANFIKDFLNQLDVEIQVHDPRFYHRVLRDQSLGLGESYMDGWWDCPQIDAFIAKILEAKLEGKLKLPPKFLLKLAAQKMFNFQNVRKSKEVAERHYNIGNDFYEAMLGKTMNYSCAYWKGAEFLDQAQRHKMELICRKLKLRPKMSLLDIGCGWGGLAQYAAEHYGVEVHGVTISAPQKEYAARRCKGLPVKIELLDYRHLPKRVYDRVVSVGMFEHVGEKNYREFMEIAHSHLDVDGLFLLHTIGSNRSHFSGDVWIEKYIFPNGMLPSIAQVGASIEELFMMEDWHNFGPDYDKTLLAWHQNFNRHWPTFQAQYGERFFRMWNYYLLSCAASFRARKIQLWQVVLSKNGLKERFSPRDL